MLLGSVTLNSLVYLIRLGVRTGIYRRCIERQAYAAIRCGRTVGGASASTTTTQNR
jgi:hypothetical protein